MESVRSLAQGVPGQLAEQRRCEPRACALGSPHCWPGCSSQRAKVPGHRAVLRCHHRGLCVSFQIVTSQQQYSPREVEPWKLQVGASHGRQGRDCWCPPALRGRVQAPARVLCRQCAAERRCARGNQLTKWRGGHCGLAWTRQQVRGHWGAKGGAPVWVLREGPEVFA